MKFQRTMSSSTVSELPSSIIFLILVKLSTSKSISRFRRVCKAWYHLISDPYFTKVYVKTHPSNMIVVSQCSKDYSYPVNETFYFLGTERNGGVTRTPFNLKFHPRIVFSENSRGKGVDERHIVGSCNGLLCLAETSYYVITDRRGEIYFDIVNREKLWVINPLTGESMNIPQVHVTQKIICYGFGSTVDGEYHKIVIITTTKENTYLNSKILTVGVDDEWRDFYEPVILNCVFPLHTYSRVLHRAQTSHGIVRKGVLHWVCSNTNSSFIYAFDIRTETGHSIPLPPGVTVQVRPLYLSVWGGHLCLTVTTSQQFDIWAMKQYGVVESWTRDVTMKTTNLRSLAGELFSGIPVSYFCSRIRLITYLLLSDPCGQNIINYRKKCVDDGVTVSCVFGYVPSFCSLRDMISTQVTNGDSKFLKQSFKHFKN